MIDIAAIKARADKATSEPWFVHDFADVAVSSAPSANDVTVSCDHPATITVAFMGGGLEGSLGDTGIEQGRKDADFIAHARTDIPALIAALEAVQAILESDRTRIIDGVNGLSDALRRRQWLLTSRGSYEWDDARFIQEFRDAIDEIDKAVEPLRSIGADKSNCPQTTAEVIQARVDLIAALEASEAARVKAEQERNALKDALTNSCNLLENYIDTFGDMSGANRADLNDYRRALEAKP